ncbi:TPA: hypothetical protein RFT53_002672 [Klebsiella aerogenes]|uniref:hypothetical protein n=1 Tax=Klebsiella aerogenes TaxID=548 RepID=UPI001F44D783|nr:hypothetical protein [Klebsiella aerogenes]HDU4641361.1 hypothetical protein [Klebsiella aerogenes]
MSKYNEIQRQLDEVSPIPKGIPKVYLLGDTGAGKTTFIRRILGTENTKFPTTRQSRTTVAPTEYVICNSSSYELTILLKSFNEINEYIKEILKEAFEKSLKGEDVLRSLRQTNDQRFRLYYLLDPSDITNFSAEVISLTPLLSEKIIELKEIFNDDITDQDEYISFAIDELNDKVECIQNNIMDLIQKNVMSICDGSRLSNESQVYKFTSTEKEDFIKKCKKTLSSDKESISPVVEYARLSGELKSEWVSNSAEIVIIDGEGIGHNTKETAQLDSRHYDFFYDVNSILLIEESKKPFIAGGKNALKSIFQRGYGEKLKLIFTKLDEVIPYDSDEPTDDDRIDYVKDGLNNVLDALKKEDVKCNIDIGDIYFIGDLDKTDRNERLELAFNSIFENTVSTINNDEVFIEPRYDFELLALHINATANDFKTHYKRLLDREHWKTIEAFNRRMYSNIDGFRMFMPITDFEETVSKYIGVFLTSPVGWKYEAIDNLKQKSINKIKREFNKLILSFIRNKLITEPYEKWKESYFLAGTGSTISRKRDITTIFSNAVIDASQVEHFKVFKDQIKDIVVKSIEKCK